MQGLLSVSVNQAVGNQLQIHPDHEGDCILSSHPHSYGLRRQVHTHDLSSRRIRPYAVHLCSLYGTHMHVPLPYHAYERVSC